MIKRAYRWLLKLPIRWKISITASVLLCVLFILYNAAQYAVLQSWSWHEEQNVIVKKTDEIQAFFKDKGSINTEESKSFLETANQRNEMIRILDAGGNPLITVSDDFPVHRVAPVAVLENKLTSNEHLLVMRSPLKVGNFTGTLEIAADMETFDKLKDVVAVVMLVGGIVAVMISGLGGFLLSSQLIKPITALTDTMLRIKHKGLKERVEVPNNQDEFSKLAQMFNGLMDSLEKSFRQQQQFVEDASHELRTPVAIIEGHLQLLQRWGKKDPSVLDESLQASIQELTRLKNLVQELLELTRADTADQNSLVECTDPKTIIQEVVSDFFLLYPDAEFQLEVSDVLDEKLAITMHHFKQILMILIDNAIKYSGDTKKIEIFGMHHEPGRIEYRIKDYGIGIPEDELPNVFDRFYRVDKARSRKIGGSGLGLAIAKRIVENYHGTIGIASQKGEGTTVTVVIPTATAQ